MRKRENKIFCKAIQHPERQLVVVIFAMDRVLLEVLERIVHPSHIPFEAEAETANVGGPRNHGPSRGFFREGLNIRMLAISFLIELSEKVDGLEVFASTILVRQ